MITTVKKVHEHKMCNDVTKVVAWNTEAYQVEGIDIVEGVTKKGDVDDDDDMQEGEYYISRDHAGDIVTEDEMLQVFVNPDELLRAIEKAIRPDNNLANILIAVAELSALYRKYTSYIKE